MNHWSVLYQQFTLGNHAAMQLWEDCHAPLPGSSVSLSSRELLCRFLNLRWYSVTRVQLGLITVLGNCYCVAVASFLGVTSPTDSGIWWSTRLHFSWSFCFLWWRWKFPPIQRISPHSTQFTVLVHWNGFISADGQLNINYGQRGDGHGLLKVIFSDT
jgi:hypothetical protein